MSIWPDDDREGIDEQDEGLLSEATRADAANEDSDEDARDGCAW